MNVRQTVTVAAIRVASGVIRVGHKWFNWPEVSERVMEYAFAVKVLAGGTGRVLEVGCVDAHNCLPTVLAALGYETHAIDIRDFKVEYPNLIFSRQNIMEVSYPDAFFDWVLAISVVEHIGLKGRYGVSDGAPSGDRKAIDEMIRVLKPDGRLVITVPYGREYRVVDSVHRIYDSDHLGKRLFAGLKIRSEEYAVRNEKKCWVLTSKGMADRTEAKSGFGYAVAMFELSKA